MKNGWIAAVMLPLAGCVVYSGPYHETRSETTSSDGQTTTRTTTVTGSGWRVEHTRTDDNTWLANPLYPKTDDFCDIAIVVLSAERARGEIQPVDYLFWDNGARVGPDCASQVLTMGFPIPDGEPKIRRMILPRQLPDGRLYVQVDGDCAKGCRSAIGYAVRKRDDGHWQVEPQPLFTWTR